MSAGELGCSYAAMLLYSDDQEVTDEKIKTILAAANIDCESYWPGLFVKALGDRENLTELLTTPGGGGGGAGPAAAGGGENPPSSSLSPAGVIHRPWAREQAQDVHGGGMRPRSYPLFGTIYTYFFLSRDQKT